MVTGLVFAVASAIAPTTQWNMSESRYGPVVYEASSPEGWRVRRSEHRRGPAGAAPVRGAPATRIRTAEGRVHGGYGGSLSGGGSRCRRRTRRGATRRANPRTAERLGRAGLRTMARCRITGVAAFNDFTAAALIGAVVRAGIGVPAPLAVIGHEDTNLARLFVPALSSVRMDLAGLARYTASVALYAPRH
ncbi:substrate-binding domain-containing protein [Nocardia gamkensis]|uniref:substrate-binding domain-containing protein n=1 Tax=Nocardia gamkensis TaxID=352869 RepID=UPI0037CCBF04